MDEPMENAKVERGRRRLRGFVIHLALYFLAMIVLVAINYKSDAHGPWFVYPMVGWGAVLAVHVAYVMGLFDLFTSEDD